jgi:hypothetical protein
MVHAAFFVFAFVNAAIFALLEIQIEGPQGWAANLPTWRVENRWTKIFYGGKTLTGYHFYILLFVLVILHGPFALGLIAFSWPAELRILACMILFWVLEDFLWFVFNPAFGLRRFRKEFIPWHAPAWWWIMPRDYWVFTPLAVALYLASW